MTTPDKLFRLDPVETKTVAPTTTFQALADSADRSIANRSINRGLAAFGQALGGLAKFKKQEQIREDIKTAKDAAVRGEVMPDVFPIAERAYRDIVDINTAADTLASIERWENGSELDLVIKDHNMSSSDKTAGLEVTYDTYYAEAVQHGMNPETAQKLRLAINAKKEKSYQRVYEQEKNLRTIEGIHAVGNTLKDAKRFAELTKIPLTDILISDWVKNNAKDLGVSHPYISESERKLVVFQVLTSDEDVMGDPDIIENIMKSEYSKGFTYENLLLGKGEDSEEMLKIYKAYVANSKAYFKDIEDKQKAADIKNNDILKAGYFKDYSTARNVNGLQPRMVADGFELGKAIRFTANMKTYQDSNIRFQEGSPQHLAAINEIRSGRVTLDSQVHDLVINGNLNPDLEKQLKSLLGEEGAQKTKFVNKYKESTKLYSNKLYSLFKSSMSEEDYITASAISQQAEDEKRELTLEESSIILNAMKKNMTIDEARRLLQNVQEIQNGMNGLAETMGTEDAIADKADGSVSSERLTLYRDTYEKQIRTLRDGITKGLEERGFPFVETGVDLGAFSPTQKEFPLVVRQKDDVFTKDFKDPSSSDSETALSEIDLSFNQNGNMDLKAYVIDGDFEGMKRVVIEELKNEQEKQKQQKEAAELKIASEKKRGPVYRATTPGSPERIALDLRIETKKQENNALFEWLGDRVEDIKNIPSLLLEFHKTAHPTTYRKGPKVSKEVAIERKKETLDKFGDLFSVKGLVEIAKDLVGLGEKDKEEPLISDKPTEIVPTTDTPQNEISPREVSKPTVETIKVTQKELTQAIETIKASPTKIPKATEESLRTKLVELNKEIKTIEASPTKSSKVTLDDIEAKQVELNKEIEAVKASPREVTTVTTDIPKATQRESAQKIEEIKASPRETPKMEVPEYTSTEQIEKVAPGLLASLPIKTQEDIKRQLEKPIGYDKDNNPIYGAGKLPSASPAFEESTARVVDIDEKENIRQQLGASSIDKGVETAKNMDKRIIKVGKHLLADSRLKDILITGDVTSLRRTKKNKHVKYNEKSGHSHGVAIDFRADWTFGKEHEILVNKFKPSLAEAGWTVVSSKAGKETVKDNDMTWMKLTNKKGEFLFVELEQHPRHVHIHYDEDHLEPENKW